jgi:transposase InsO family protein
MLRAQGYPVKQIALAMEISRQAAYYKKQVHHPETVDSNGALERKIQEISLKHPSWGYRRVGAWLRKREGILVNHKKIRRIMKDLGLQVHRAKKREYTTQTRSKPKADKPNQIWGIDMTKFLIESLGWVYLVIVLDWCTKRVMGYSIQLRSRTQEWIEALQMAIGQLKVGIREAGLKLVSDNGSQPTSRRFIEYCAELRIQQIWASYENPKGNAETERHIRTLKEDLIWVKDFQSLPEAKTHIHEWIKWYNREYVHSALRYQSPEEFEKSLSEGIKEVA